MLDIGCATANLGELVKQMHPHCRVIGVEPNRAMAKAAEKKIDQVLCQKFEDVDFDKAGIAHHSIDTVVIADVLEHLYNPWQLMTGLRRLLSPDAQIIISIPNTRHLGLMKALIDDGQWSYAEKGLLDITHIRFFTLREMATFLEQTGYRVEHVNYFLDRRLEDFYAQNHDKAEINVQLGRVKFEQVGRQEFAELCTWQFFIRARPLIA